MSESNVVLNVQQLHTSFKTNSGYVQSVKDVSFQVQKGETLAIVGESGSGKSVTALSIMGLIEKPGVIEKGKIELEQVDLTKINDKEYRKLRGNDIAMIFQEPLTSLNPLFTIGNQIAEAIKLHQGLDTKQAKVNVIELLKRVGIPRAEKVYYSYPHTLSGGMRQRVMIAMALSCKPKLLIADEPTTALDVTIQAQILELMKKLKDENNTAIILITHDLGVVAEMADSVAVMYAGQIVEFADVFTIFADPKHPYTQGLLNSTPKFYEKNEVLQSIKGTVPTSNSMPIGCRFNPRCPYVTQKCLNENPSLKKLDSGRQVRCWLVEEEGETLV
ncbi:ABC transporter ATP-binding protein [Lysinibacillus telephonicus]|uniref:ABC transporter ATP-binding protein n=1 Tax=Lysinibacillus telephonicus TaxID=1714840 RepID=A0A431UU42_9BACI|nr:ABC transporter ATP-binding protein [Lysinibacillus telephonicus]RTQ93872.1 ABC transporter ATP-binding protein [Lysinibacillus telephonicus]